MHTFVFRSPIPASAAELFSWHERPGAFQRLIPPWDHVELLHKDAGVKEGVRVHIRIKQGAIKINWVAQHGAFKRGELFTDIQIKGPFNSWTHQHRFHAVTKIRSELEEHIEYRLPGGPLINALIGPFIDRKLKRTFAYRHRVTAHDLSCLGRYPDVSPLRIAISGTRGMLGEALASFLELAGHKVIRVVPAKYAQENELPWNPGTGKIDQAQLENLDAFFHLWVGNNPKGRWTEQKRHEAWNTRVQATRNLLRKLQSLKTPPKCLINASSMAVYGDLPEHPLIENSKQGEGFLAQLYHEREQACYELADSRIAHLRLGMVLTPKGGHLQKILRPFQLGLGGRIGTGKQYWSWISLDDFLYQCYHVLMTDDLVGAVNVVSPYPVRNAEFTKILGRLVNRPTWLPMPKTIAHLVIGDGALPLLLSSRKGIPRKLIESGAAFTHPELEGALKHVLGIY